MSKNKSTTPTTSTVPTAIKTSPHKESNGNKKGVVELVANVVPAPEEMDIVDDLTDDMGKLLTIEDTHQVTVFFNNAINASLKLFMSRTGEYVRTAKNKLEEERQMERESAIQALSHAEIKMRADVEATLSQLVDEKIAGKDREREELFKVKVEEEVKKRMAELPPPAPGAGAQGDSAELKELKAKYEEMKAKSKDVLTRYKDAKEKLSKSEAELTELRRKLEDKADADLNFD